MGGGNPIVDKWLDIIKFSTLVFNISLFWIADETVLTPPPLNAPIIPSSIIL
jgi:hypothetical protein